MRNLWLGLVDHETHTRTEVEVRGQLLNLMSVTSLGAHLEEAGMVEQVIDGLEKACRSPPALYVRTERNF